jgi:hypothetical protein
MQSFWVGITLILLGAVIWLFGRRGPRGGAVVASKGSVAIGGDNTGSISNINKTDSGHDGHGFLTKLAIFVELLGIASIIWHTIHMAAK